MYADIFPQAGIETYVGSNRLFILTPWAGLRVKLTNNSSLSFKYYNHNISFENPDDQPSNERRTAHLSNFSTVYYAQKRGNDFYFASSYFVGSDSYRALAIDAGTVLKITNKLYAEPGVYFLREKSTLWYPDEEVRSINIYSMKFGLKYRINKWLSITPKIYIYKNSEKVKASTYSIGLTFVPKEPIFITLYYFKYKESARYRFSGDYISLGLNFYY
jgi:hypothetical protein